jgi:predicted  nucleic acid-binding Zn-ribbon protein
VSLFFFPRKQLTIEIETLTARLADAETKLKTEVQRIKKKMQAQITELEMQLDNAQRANLEAHKTIKKQQLHIQVNFLILKLT